MKICHVNLARGFRGGERQTQLLIEALARRGVSQSLVCRRGDELARRMSAVPELDVIEISKPFFLHLSASKHSDLIHAHEGKAAHFAMLSGQWCGKPYVLTRRVMTSPKNNAFTHRVYGRSTAIVCLSTAIKECMNQYDSRLNCFVIPSAKSGLPVNTDEVKELRKRFQGKRIIGHIGALVNDDKGQYYLIEVARRFQKQFPDVMFLFVGSGRDEIAFKRQAAGLSNIEFIGFVDNVGDYLSLFDLFAFPSLREGLGSILLDAMQFSKPIVASSVGGIPDVIEHEKNGLLVPPADVDSLYAALLRLLQDQSLAARLADAGRHTLDHYDANEIAHQHEKMYQRLLWQN